MAAVTRSPVSDSGVSAIWTFSAPRAASPRIAKRSCSARANRSNRTLPSASPFLPCSPLGGIGRAGKLGSRHAAFQQVADAHGVSPQQVALAWMLAKAPVVIPIPGASRPESIIDSAQAADLPLTPAELTLLNQP